MIKVNWDVEELVALIDVYRRSDEKSAEQIEVELLALSKAFVERAERLGIGKGVIKALGKPSHVSIKISDSRDSLSIFPCDEDDVMAFRVPLKLFIDHRCVMRINSKQFVHGIMRTNQMDTSKTYVLSGEFLEEKNTAVFSLVEGVSLRTQKGMAQS